jgi:hypothetical protein
MNYTERFNKLVKTWERCYMATISSVAGLKARLYELDTWDKPRPGNAIEHEAKEKALQNLILKLAKKVK